MKTARARTFSPKGVLPFLRFVRRRLHHQPFEPFGFRRNGYWGQLSAVLFLLGLGPDRRPCLILNKRSRRVRQPGDLCCPGGGLVPVLDPFFAKLLDWPLSPLFSWPYRAWWKLHFPSDYDKLKLLLAAALREAAEEMRLNPLGVRFMGRLPVQQLVLFKRSIYPLVGWVNRQQRFWTNWEVDRIVRIPIDSFFNTANYARFRLSCRQSDDRWEMPCFLQQPHSGGELLWGATYRMAMHFLGTVFGFSEPPMALRPLISHSLGRDYYTGSKT